MMQTSAMRALKEATWDIHAGLEKRLAVKDRFADLASYREHLGRLWAFYSAAEIEWSEYLEQSLGDFSQRRKAPLLVRDIESLGGLQLQEAAIPKFTDIASALGGFYVLEGATLGGQQLLPLAQSRLGVTPQRGASYLASYGQDIRLMWQKFGAAVDHYCQTDERQGLAINAARATFLAMEDLLCA